MGDDKIPLMRVTDHGGDVYWMEGHNPHDAVESFGQDIAVDLFYGVAVDVLKVIDPDDMK